MNDIDEILEAFIRKEFLSDKPEIVLERDSPLIGQSIIDSLGIFLLIAFIEKQFDLKIPPEEVVLHNFETVGAIRNFINSRKEC